MKEFSSFIKNLETLISFESVRGEPKKDMPFGEQVYLAYSYFYNLAKEFGFEVINYDNYIGEVVFGSGEEIGIIGHLDVVPAGDGWLTPPFKLTKTNKTYFGRGILDDKAPLLSCLYALKELKESGKTINKKYRLFFGCNEESGWEDVEYLNKKTTLPEYGFSPDGNFPVSYAEKAMCIVTFRLERFKNFTNVKGGTVVNAVCGKCTAQPTGEPNLQAIKKHNLNYNQQEIVSVGKSAHGSRPELGINAIKLMLEYFSDCGENVSNVLDCLFYDKFGLSKMVCEQGTVTISPNIIGEDENGVYLTCDLRFPAPFTVKDITNVLDRFNIEYSLQVKHGTQFVSKESELVEKLITAYGSVTGENLAPVSQSGSTFARVFRKGVAFGPEFPSSPSTIHEPNECASEEELKKMYEIYKTAIFLLAE